jgi:hypothetical protein
MIGKGFGGVVVASTGKPTTANTSRLKIEELGRIAEGDRDVPFPEYG